MADILGNYETTADLFTQDTDDDAPVRLSVSKRRDRTPEICIMAPRSTGEVIMTEAEFEGFVSMARRLFKQSDEARTAYENGVRGAGVDEFPQAAE